MLQVESVSRGGRMQGEQWQRPRVPLCNQARGLARWRQAAKCRYLPEGAPDGVQVLNELVGDEQRLAVQAFDQLAQPVDLQAVDHNRRAFCWIVSGLVVEEAVGQLRQLAGRDQLRS